MQQNQSVMMNSANVQTYISIPSSQMAQTLNISHQLQSQFQSQSSLSQSQSLTQSEYKHVPAQMKQIKKKITNRKLRIFGLDDEQEQKRLDEQQEYTQKYKRDFYLSRLYKSTLARFFDFSEFIIHFMKFIYDYLFCCRLICYIFCTDIATQRRRLVERKNLFNKSALNSHNLFCPPSSSSTYSTSILNDYSSNTQSLIPKDQYSTSSDDHYSSLNQYSSSSSTSINNEGYSSSTSSSSYSNNLQLSSQNYIQSSMRMYDDHPNNLVLDLDETLIHCNERSLNNDAQPITVQFYDSSKTFFLHQRGFLQDFLERCAQNFNIYIYTASVRPYADEVVKHIDPRLIIKKVYCRSSCFYDGKIYNKSLKTLGLDLNRTVMIDNSQAIVSNNTENAFKIKDFINDKSDRELLKFSNILNKMANTTGNFKDIIQNYQS